MKQKILKVGIIGAGFITGTQHIPAVRSLKEKMQLCAIADCRQEALTYTADLFGIEKRYTDACRMLEENDLDLVHVCTANNTHKEFTIAALRKGCHVLCEKPLALTRKDVEDMFEEAERNARLLMTCQNSRIGALQEIKKIYEAGRLGEVYYTEIENIRRRGVPTWGRFHIKEENGGGPFCDVGVHYLDGALFVLGNPGFKSVSANTYTGVAAEANADEEMQGIIEGKQLFLPRKDYDRRKYSVEDYAAGLVRFENGMQMQMRFSWAINLPVADAYRFAGSRSGLVYRKGEGLKNPISLYGQTQGYLENTELEVPIARPGAMIDNGHRLIIENMADAILYGEELLVKKEETLNVTGIIQAFYLSAKYNREISFEDLKRLERETFNY